MQITNLNKYLAYEGESNTKTITFQVDDIYSTFNIYLDFELPNLSKFRTTALSLSRVFSCKSLSQTYYVYDGDNYIEVNALDVYSNAITYYVKKGSLYVATVVNDEDLIYVGSFLLPQFLLVEEGSLQVQVVASQNDKIAKSAITTFIIKKSINASTTLSDYITSEQLSEILSNTLQDYQKSLSSENAGLYINIVNDIISVDTNVALKSDIITDYNDLTNKPDLSVYQEKLTAGNLILIDDNQIKVDDSKVNFNNNTILGINNVVDELAGHTAITNIVLGYQNKISKDSIDGVIANADILIGYKNETYSFNYYTTLLGQENYAYYAQNSLALGYKNKIGNRYSSPDENLIAIGTNNNVGNATTKVCKNIIGIGNGIDNQENYTFVIDTNTSGTYGTNRSSLVGNLQGLYYNGEKMATETYVDEHGGGSGGSPLQIHYITSSYLVGDSTTYQTVNFSFYSYITTSFTYATLLAYLQTNGFTSRDTGLPVFASTLGSTANNRQGAEVAIYTNNDVIYITYLAYNTIYKGSICTESDLQLSDPTGKVSSFFRDTVKTLK